MAPKSKPKKKTAKKKTAKTKTTKTKTKSPKPGARAKTAARSAKHAVPARGAGAAGVADETTATLRASAKSFAARLLR